MAIYNQEQGFQSILNAALGEYQTRGFRLVEDGDHFLRLYYQDSILEVFSQARGTILALHRTCQEHLEMLDAS